MSGDHLLPPLNLRTTAEVVKQSSVSFMSNLTTFVFLSVVLFTFKTAVESGSLVVTTLIDRDISLKTLLSEQQQQQQPEVSIRRRQRTYHRLTRLGRTLDDDFFSTSDDFAFVSNKSPPLNASLLNLSHHYYFFDRQLLGFSTLYQNNKDHHSSATATATATTTTTDVASLFFLVSLVSAAYGCLILVYFVMQSCLLGLVFLAVVNNHLGTPVSFFRTFLLGSKLGFRRLSGFILVRWAIKDVFTQFLGLCFFADIQDQYSFLRVFLRLKLMPFTVHSPWIQGFDKEISRFELSWFILDTFVSFLFRLDSWIAIMDNRMSSRGVVREGCYLISTMFNQALILKAFEAILCGFSVRWLLGGIFGSFFQSVAEVYFMVVWLIYYFAARSNDINSNGNGRRFGRRQLENFVNRLRLS